MQYQLHVLLLHWSEYRLMQKATYSSQQYAIPARGVCIMETYRGRGALAFTSGKGWAVLLRYRAEEGGTWPCFDHYGIGDFFERVGAVMTTG